MVACFCRGKTIGQQLYPVYSFPTKELSCKISILYTKFEKHKTSAICNKIGITDWTLDGYSVADTCCSCVADKVSATLLFLLVYSKQSIICRRYREVIRTYGLITRFLPGNSSSNGRNSSFCGRKLEFPRLDTLVSNA